MNWKYSPLYRGGIGASGAPLIERRQPIIPGNGGYGSKGRICGEMVSCEDLTD